MLPMTPHRFLVTKTPVDDPPPAVQFLQDHVGPHERFDGLLCRRPGGRLSDYPLLTPNQATAWDLRDIRISGPLWLSDYARLNRRWTAINEGFTVSTFTQADARFLSWLGVSYVAAPHGEPPREGFRLAYSGGSMDVWKVEGDVARARMVFNWTRCDDGDRAARLSRSLFSAASPLPVLPVAGIAPSGPPPARKPEWDLRWLDDGPEHVALAVRTSHAGLLFLADSYHPGWRSRLDGRPSPIYEAMGAFRAVLVPAGEHTVTFRYVSESFRWGGALSLVTLLAILLIGVVGLVAPRTRHAERSGADGT
jgi:hypothetical protein